jgi:hypothetical protein
MAGLFHLAKPLVFSNFKNKNLNGQIDSKVARFRMKV